MAKVIMIQGTMSNVGKSLIVAGLCRILKQDGYKVAPFKSQNMALNSFITEEGLEMSRAQVMQCEAAGIKPSVNMNPILLKPTNDMGSQVIVNGTVIGNFSAKEYFEKKKSFLPEIKKAYTALKKQYDIIVVEGAGSPAEINLKQNDIVNMGIAKLLRAPVILVGDIDRGGVFAQIVGTMALLEPSEQKRVKGFILNKFRGDVSLLQSGITFLEQKCNNKVLGVIPYMNVDIEDEDSIAERLHSKKNKALLNIAVVRLPHISNFTDFNRLEAIEGVSVYYAYKVEQLEYADMIILPGTKNTIEDLLFIRQQGIESAIKKLANRGVIIFGICGGYQMMGESITDKYGVEKMGTIDGMGLLPVVTTFQPQKTMTRVRGKFLNICGDLKELSGKPFYGYEIHMGETKVIGEQHFYEIISDDNTVQKQGAYCQNCYGTYVHGIFDEEQTAKALLIALCRKKDADSEKLLCHAVNWEEYKQRQYDILAEIMRQNLDMNAIYDILMPKSHKNTVCN
ncbi:cobyric acid synthase [Lachnospiraceae bacterium 46-61]